MSLPNVTIMRLSDTAYETARVGNNLHRVVEQIGFFTGLGLVIVFLAAVPLGASP